MPSSERREHCPSTPGHTPARAACPASPVRVLRPYRRHRSCRAASGRARGPSPPGLARLRRHTTCACVTALSSLSGQCRAARGREQGPSQPGQAGLARLGPRTACACVAALSSLSAEPSSMREEAGPLPAGSGSGRTQSMRVSRPHCRCLSCLSARGREALGGSGAPSRRVLPVLGCACCGPIIAVGRAEQLKGRREHCHS